MAVNETAEHPNPGRWWRHRRAGYYSGIVWAVVQTIGWAWLEVKRPGTIEAMGVVIGWSYGACVTLILGYYGNTALEEHAKKGVR